MNRVAGVKKGGSRRPLSYISDTENHEMKEFPYHAKAAMIDPTRNLFSISTFSNENTEVSAPNAALKALTVISPRLTVRHNH